jgi:uncharacterized membrane protein
MHLRRYLVAGLLVWLPVGVTMLVFKLLLDMMDRLLFLVPAAYRPETLLGFRIPGLGAILAFIVLLVTGILAANLIGRRLVIWFESLLGRIPLVRTVYGAVKNFASVVLSGSSRSFKRVLLIQYPRKGVYRVALQTADQVGELKARTQQDLIGVFVPTTPNATSGFVVFVPRDEVIELSMPVEDALKMIVSMGVVVPQWHEDPTPEASPEVVEALAQHKASS